MVLTRDAAVARGEYVSDISSKPLTPDDSRTALEETRSGPPAIVAEEISPTVKASLAQERLWFLHRLADGRDSYTVPLIFRVYGPLDEPKLQAALTELVRRHSSLRSRFTHNGISLEIATDLPYPVRPEVFDLRAVEPNRASAEHDALIRAIVDRPFDLQDGNLFRTAVIHTGDSSSFLIFVFHHIIFDDWSASIFLEELTRLYSPADINKPLPASPPEISYAKFSRLQREQYEGGGFGKQLDYWRHQLEGATLKVPLLADRRRPTRPTYAAAIEWFQLGSETTAGVERLCAEAGVTLFMVLVAALQATVMVVSGTRDVVLAAPVTNRSSTEFDRVIGLFLNLLLIRTRGGAGATLGDLLVDAKASVLEGQENADIPIEAIVQDLKLSQSVDPQSLFQVAISLQDDPFSISLGEAQLEAVCRSGGRAKFDLNLIFRRDKNGLVGGLEYATELYSCEMARRLSRRFRNVLEALVDAPETSIADLTPLDPSEFPKLLADGCGQNFPATSRMRLRDMFSATVDRSPGKVALRHQGSTLTYAELDAKANALANHILKRGWGEGSIIAVCLPRSMDLIVTLLGVLKAGAAYLPLDPNYSAERLSYMVEDARVSGVITHTDLLHRFATINVPNICLDAGDAYPFATARPSVATSDDAPAYVIYTSGSTGRPKGVVVEDSAAMLVEWARTAFGAEDIAVVAATTSVCFDISVFEIFVPLCLGGSVAIFDDVLALPARTEPVTLICAVPTSFREIVHDAATLDGVRMVVLGGEALDRELVQAIREAEPTCRVVNGYGPTEYTTFATYWNANENEAPLIGRPLPGTRAYILNDNLDLIPAGVTGELYLAGAGLAQGYLGRSDLTCERFVANSLGPPGTRMYRTGDLARWTAAGQIEWLGRADDQVKIRGFRIEPREIEIVLTGHPKVWQAAVATLPGTDGAPTLAAFASAIPGAELTVAELDAYLRTRLPQYMLPSGYMLLENLPTNSNGKVDRKALTSVWQWNSQDAPATQLTPFEISIAQVWEDVLNSRKIGPDDNFFLIGGHSLLATRLLKKLRNNIGTSLPLEAIFAHPTLRSFAAHVSETLSMAAATPTTSAAEGDFPWFLSEEASDERI